MYMYYNTSVFSFTSFFILSPLLSLGSKLQEISVGSSDYIVHINWSRDNVSPPTGLWLCGFSRLIYCNVERNDKGNDVCEGRKF